MKCAFVAALVSVLILAFALTPCRGIEATQQPGSLRGSVAEAQRGNSISVVADPGVRYLGRDSDGRAHIAVGQAVLHVSQGDTVADKWVVKSINDKQLVLHHDLTQEEKDALRARGATVYESQERIVVNLSYTPVVIHENQWGPFEGRVVDAEGGEAIVGAALIVFWKKAIPNPVEGIEEFEDGRWAVTDSAGAFSIPRRDPPFFRFLMSGAYLVSVAPGYLPYEFRPKYDPEAENRRLQEGPIIVRLRKVPILTHEQKLGRLEEFSAGSLISFPDERLQEFARAVNAKRAVMGLPAIRLHSGELE